VNNSPAVEIWGTGSPLREFLYVDDLAEACYHLMLNYNGNQFVNVGSGTDISIKDLALTIKSIVGFEGELTFDSSKPDGTPRKLMDVSNLAKAGWSYKIKLEDGIKMAYQDALEKGLLNE
jgi:GDP-L-fucose synthase